MKIKNIFYFNAIIIFCLLALNACKIYSFTGTSLSDDYKTFSIQNFTLAIAGGPQNLSLSFNEKIKEYYQRNTNLKFRSADGDIHLEGVIIGYELIPVSATAGDKAAMNRLSIAVEVKFFNKINPDENFEKEFSFYQDFSQEKSLTEVEPNLVPKILEQLILNIFTATTMANSW